MKKDMEKKMNIRLGFGCAAALLIAMMFASCTKEELFSAPVKKSDEINFGVNLKWDDDEVSTRSGVDYGSRAGSFMLRSEDSADSLTVNVYVKNTISESAPITKGSVVENADAIADFGVYCSLDNGSETVPYFLNLEATQENGFWKPVRDCYWPGSDFTKLKFLAVAPYEHGMTSIIASGSVMPTSFSYTVPEAAVDQNDIMMAVTGEYPGDHNQTVPVTFNHLLSAINVKIGSVPEGTIHSITLKDVGSSSTYTVAGGTWEACTATDDFAVDFAGDGDTFATTGTETGNPQINAAEATFMMIPQTLGESAYLEVVFTHTITNNNVTLTASLANINWEKSKTYNYLINIEPDFILNIEEENVPIADCHYDVREITISDDANAGWILTSNVDWVKFRVKPDNFDTSEYKDYWIEEHVVTNVDITMDQTKDDDPNTTEDERITTETSSTSYSIMDRISGTGATKILVYFYENIETGNNEIARSATLSLRDTKNNERNTIIVNQYYPLWGTGNIAYERIEENKNTHPWGFASSRTVTYKYPAVNKKPSWATDLFGGFIWAIIELLNWDEWFYQSQKERRGEVYQEFYESYYTSSQEGFITITPTGGDGTTEWGYNNSWSVKLDYSKLNNINTQSTGLQNTRSILTYAGGSTGSDSETYLVNNSLEKTQETNTTDATTIPQTAAYQAVMKNSWIMSTTITTTTTITEKYGEQTDTPVTANDVELATEDIQWFLPSASEVATLLSTACDSDTNNNDTALSGTYWSSTSASGTNSISYDAAGTTSSASRTQRYKIRAARMKP